MKTRLIRGIALLWLVGITYYLSTDIYASVTMHALPRETGIRIVAAVWVGCAAVFLLRGQAAGWWIVVAFFWFMLGGQTSRLLSQPNSVASSTTLEPLAWSVGWLLVLAWLRSNVGGRSGVVGLTHPGRQTAGMEARG